MSTEGNWTVRAATEYTYIATPKTAEILDNFSYENPSESVYRITGVRGSGNGEMYERIRLCVSTAWRIVFKKKSEEGLSDILPYFADYIKEYCL